jgi:hypothetical protein
MNPQDRTSVSALTKPGRLNGASDEEHVFVGFFADDVRPRAGLAWRGTSPKSAHLKNTAEAWRRQRRDAGDPNKKAPYADEYSTSTASETSTVGRRGARLRRRIASR